MEVIKINIDSFTLYLANIITPDEKKTDQNLEIISYGICSIITTLLNLFFCFVTSFFLGLTNYLFIFLIFFTPLRLLHKGFHCKTFLHCLLLTNLLFSFSSICCYVYCDSYSLKIFAIIALFMHYYISNEKRIVQHFIYLCIFLYLLFFRQCYLVFYCTAFFLDILLIIGGKFNEKFN